MPNYVRAHIPGGSFFFTVALLERHRTLLTDHVDLLREAFRSVKALRHFTMEAIVILPDHLHCIWTLPDGDADFSTRWRLIKARFARGIPSGERGIWQRRFWEHALRDQQDFNAHVDYIHFNPVKHGYVNEEIDDGVWNAYFGPLKLGRLNERYRRIEDANGSLLRHR